MNTETDVTTEQPTDDLGWRASLPEEMRDLPFIGKAPNLEKAIHDIRDAAQYMGNSIRIPSENASDEDRQKFTQRVLEKMPHLTVIPGEDDDEAYARALAALGAPAEAAHYPAPKLDGFDWSEDDLADLRERAQAAGLTKKQFKQWATDIGSRLRDERLEADETHNADLGSIKSEWGAAFDSRVTQISRWLEDSSAPEGFVAAVKNKQVPSSTLKWLHNLHSKMNQREGGNVADQGLSGEVPVLSPDEAKMQIQEILNNPAYWDAASPSAPPLRRKMIELQKFANAR